MLASAGLTPRSFCDGRGEVLSTRVVVSAFAVWGPSGVSVNAPPMRQSSLGLLAPWPDAPALAVIHPSARRPPRQAAVLVQLAHALLGARRKTETHSPSEWAETDLLLGTVKGSEAADRDFLQSVQERGNGFGSPSTFVYTLSTAAPAEVALALGLHGSLATLTAGSISGLSAVVRAAKHVGQGRSRACITGGVELPGRGQPTVLGDSEGEIAALFLLEPSAEASGRPTISDAELGFDPEALDRSDSPTATLLALASACAEPRAIGPVEIAGRSREGHWARLSVRW